MKTKPPIEELRIALEKSAIAIDDWLHQYASDMCDETSVEISIRRIRFNGGTLAYIAGVQERNHAALKKLDEYMKREENPSTD